MAFFPWEFEFLMNFAERIHACSRELWGYVRLLGERRFLLIPLPWLLSQAYVLCEAISGLTLPPDGGYIRVEGLWHYELNAKTGKVVKKFLVEYWEPMPQPRVTPTTQFKEVIDCFPWYVDETMKTLAILNIISSPGFVEIPGGVTETVYNFSSKKRTSFKFINYVKRLLPIAKPKTIRLDEIGIKISPKYHIRYLFGSVERLPSIARIVLTKEIKTLNETCLTLGASRPPESIIEEPLSLADLPMFLTDEDIPLTPTRFSEVPSEMLEHTLAAHLHTPQIRIEEIERILDNVRNAIIQLAQSYDIMNPLMLGRGQLLSLNYRDRPASFLRAARAYARAEFLKALKPCIALDFYHKFYESMIKNWIEFLE